jgi:hemoglobin-like flavoprotein
MPPTDLELFDASLTRCYANPRFLERFYELFLEASPEARAKFAHTDMEQQRRMLKASLVLMMLGAGGKQEGKGHLERVAGVHGRTELDIPPPLYDVWLDCLLKTVGEFDPQSNEPLLQTWRRMLAPGIAFMKSRYDARRPAG